MLNMPTAKKDYELVSSGQRRLSLRSRISVHDDNNNTLAIANSDLILTKHLLRNIHMRVAKYETQKYKAIIEN